MLVNFAGMFKGFDSFARHWHANATKNTAGVALLGASVGIAKPQRMHSHVFKLHAAEAFPIFECSFAAVDSDVWGA